MRLATEAPGIDRSGTPEPCTLRRALLTLAGAALIGIALALIFPDGHQQDAGNHFLFARFATADPQRFISVWNRPLFTTIYALPAQFGYLAAKLFTLVIALATSWQTYRLARDLRCERPALVIALLFLQPSFLLLATETMTEPMFALLFVVAVRLFVAESWRLSALVASLLILVRPEGFILGMVWALALLRNSRLGVGLAPRLRTCGLLATGIGLWWIAAYAITADPFFLHHNWPRQWSITDQTYGSGSLATYVLRLPEFAGPLLAVFLVRGLVSAVRLPAMRLLVTSFCALFVVHSLLRATGALGSIGSARYFVCIAPATALLTLHGLREIERPRVLAPLFAVSGLAALYYIDYSNFEGRDVHAIHEMKDWIDHHPVPITRVIWSQAYMGIVFDRDPAESPSFERDHEANLAWLRQAPAGTLVFWDDHLGPERFHLRAEDFEAAGYSRLRTQTHRLAGWFRADLWNPRARLREQAMHLLYKPGG
jgi:hypothetical protein